MRGFVSRVNGDERYTWTFRVGRPPVETNLRNVGSEGYFYGPPGKDSLDDKITKRVENVHTSTHEWLRSHEGTVAKDRVPEVASLFYWLAMRSRNVRDALRDLAEQSVHRIESEWATSDLLVESLRNSGDALRSGMLRGLEGLGVNVANLSPTQIASFEAYLRANLDSVAPEIQPFFAQLFRDLKPKAEKMVAEAQLDALSGAIDERTTMEGKLGELRWRVARAGFRVVLGDTAGFALSESGEPKLPYIGVDSSSAFVLPVAADRLLVGSRSDAPVDLTSANRASVALSAEFFVSREAGDPERELHSRIGEVRETELSISTG